MAPTADARLALSTAQTWAHWSAGLPDLRAEHGSPPIRPALVSGLAIYLVAGSAQPLQPQPVVAVPGADTSGSSTGQVHSGDPHWCTGFTS
ncbi:MAG: hypothetical protein M4D85_02390, partial [Actinomycetota bacterium]|nr:hypothetical protein [Actinomycetota bacterium]